MKAEHTKGITMRKIGINHNGIKGLEDREFIREIAGLGFGCTFVPFLDPIRQAHIGDLCAAYGIECETLHAPFYRINDIWMDTAAGDEALAELKQCVEHCRIAGASIMVVHLSSGATPPSITDAGRSRFTRLVDFTAAKNVRIAFENQRMLANLAWALETFPEDCAGFCWDCGHENCFTPGRRYMPLFSKRLLCTHIHDNMGVYNEDSHLIPFEGNVDFAYVAEAIRESGFTGTLMLEIGNKTQYDEKDTPEFFLEKAAAAAGKLRFMIDGE